MDVAEPRSARCAGGTGLVAPEPEAELEADARGRLAADLREVCARKGFDIVYQPQTDVRMERVTGFEALIRWHHPMRGDVSPDAFIALAEEIGLIGEIGAWVLARACREATGWPDPVGLAVNVSALQIADSAFPATVATALSDAGLAASRLELEVSQTRAMPDDAVSLPVLRAIRAMGVGIVLDGFDIGRSALGALVHFPFSKIKIDGSRGAALPCDAHQREAAGTVLRGIVGLCADLGMGCLAAWVESEEQLAVLTRAGCSQIQGHLLGRPQALADTEATLRRIPDGLLRMKARGGAATGDGALARNRAISFRQISEAAHDIILVTTADLDPPGPVIAYVNPAFTRLNGFSETEAPGQSPRMLHGPGGSQVTLDRVIASLRAGRPVQERIVNFGKSGAPYWLDMQIVPLHDAEGRITHFAAVERDVTLDKRRLDELEQLADRDALTGIANRRAFLRGVSAECAAAEGRGFADSPAKGLCLAFIDIDYFKRINDTRGHATGDAVLCGMADYLAQNIRRLDMIGRLGGEEFGVCMPAIGLRDAKVLAERLRCAVAAAAFDTPGGPVTITVSVGVACHRAGDSVATLMARADAAMYVAKRAGRNRVRVEVSREETRMLKAPDSGG